MMRSLKFLRRVCLRWLSLCAVWIAGLPAVCGEERRPNVLLILTDDQGYADVGFTGNPLVETPVLDKLAAASVVFDTFYAMPLCSPSRAALMTGKDPHRTGVLDTAKGRAMLPAEELTMAEAFREAGYTTAIFGKWHLGDNYPLRAMDQGFDVSLVHRAGMLGGSNALDGERSYWDPVLIANGEPRQYTGYCNDIYTKEAIHFLKSVNDRPFFLYFSTNLPHHPLTAPEEDRQVFLDKKLSGETAQFYGMIRNTDRNIGRLVEALKQLGVLENTIIVFLGDNGTSSLLRESDRYDGGLRGRKGQVYEGGIRVPCFISWPVHFRAAHVDRIGCVTDLMPTLLDACGIAASGEMDGISLVPLLENPKADWPDRHLVIQLDRTDEPRPFSNAAIWGGDYKLLRSLRAESESDGPGDLELYRVKSDPGERQNLAAEHPEVVKRMKKEYDEWFQKMKAARSQPPRIVLGSDRQPLILLATQDKRQAGLKDPASGHWDVKVERPVRYDIVVHFADRVPIKTTWRASLQIGDIAQSRPAFDGEWEARFPNVEIPAGETQIRVRVEAKGMPVPVESITVRQQKSVDSP